MTNDLRMDVRTALRFWKDRWAVEEMHKELEQLFGLRGIFCRSGSMIRARISFCYLLHLVFSIGAAELSRLGAPSQHTIYGGSIADLTVFLPRDEVEFVYI